MPSELQQADKRDLGQRAQYRRILTDPDTYATVMVTLFIDHYGTEALTWHPEAIKLQIEDDFQVQLPKLNCDRLMAAITLLTTNYFYASVSRFIDLCNVLAGDDFDPSEFNPADSVECAWGITEAMALCPPDSSEPFTEEIRQYVGFVLRSEGYIKAPDVLRIAMHPDLSDKITDDFADDPAMFAAINQAQGAKADDVTNAIQDNLREMLTQLAALPLANGNTSELLKRMPVSLRPA